VAAIVDAKWTGQEREVQREESTRS